MTEDPSSLPESLRRGDSKPQYQWPKYVLAGVIVFLVAAVIWVSIDVYKLKHERDFGAPVEGR